MGEFQITPREGCTGCGCCVAACPVTCISMEADAEGFAYPSVDGGRCVSCGKCRRACLANVRGESRTAPSSFYMAQHRTGEVLSKCSSGGVFDALAAITLSRGGVVFGAVRDQETGKVVHISATDIAGLAPMRLSKYDQSSSWDAYPQVRSLLGEGRPVLFTGTPCQVAALRAFLGPAYDDPNLVTMEVLCHGVTSGQVVASYLESKARSVEGEIVGVRFRTKDGPWGWEDSSHAVLVMREGGGERLVRDRTDSFMFGYIRSLFLRESCYRCKYCSTTRIADFMAGDYWGITDEEMPRSQRRKGVSLLAVTGPRAESLLPDIEKSLSLQQIGDDCAVRGNGALVEPAKRPQFRDVVFSRLGTRDFESVIVKEFRSSIIKRNIKTRIGPDAYRILKSVKQAITRF